MKNIIAISLLTALSQCLNAQSWTQVSLPTNGNWYAVACSADGSRMVTGDVGPYAPGSPGGQIGIWYSTNSGTNWAQADVPTNAAWQGFAVSADGTKMFAVDGGNETIEDSSTNYGIWDSTDSGAHWSQLLAQTNGYLIHWFSIACSADGSKLAAVGNGAPNNEGVYTSTNGGATWQQQTTTPASGQWRWICSSDDGHLLAAVFNYDSNLGIVVSTNFGATWATNNAPINDAWQTITCTPDGTKLYAVGNDTGLFWVSTNSGATWSQETSLPGNLANFGVAVSANGIRQVVTSLGGIYGSTNGGLSWIEETNEPDSSEFTWQGVAASADGGTRVAANSNYAGTGGTPVYTSKSVVRPQLNLASVGTNAVVSWIVPSSSFSLQAIGSLTNANWAAVTNQPVLNLTNLRNQVVVPRSGTNGFFRLLH